MVASFMLKINYQNSLPAADLHLLRQIQADYPTFCFKNGQKFKFSPPNTITLGPPQPNYALLSLHELAHAVLKHKDYIQDIQLLKIESEAWKEAKKLCLKYNINWDEDFAQDQLDSYRDWLHYRSLCPHCKVNGYQSSNGENYHCPLCGLSWPSQKHL